MKLEYLMTFNAALKKGMPVGKGPYGFRSFSEFTGGEFEVQRLAG